MLDQRQDSKNKSIEFFLSFYFPRNSVRANGKKLASARFFGEKQTYTFSETLEHYKKTEHIFFEHFVDFQD